MAQRALPNGLRCRLRTVHTMHATRKEITPLLEDYLRQGYRDIVLIGGESHEDKDFHETERNTEIVVAKKGAGFLRATGFEKRQCGPGGTSYCEIRSEEPINIVSAVCN